MTILNIECAVRAFLTEEQHAALLERLKRHSMYGGEERQTTYEYGGAKELRIQQSSLFSKIWLKLGDVREEFREEVMVHCDRNDFENLEKIFEALGYTIATKWFRLRHLFKSDGFTIALDHTRGYGHTIEIEKHCVFHEKERVLKELKDKLAELGFAPSPKEEFDRRLKQYKEHWKELTSAGGF